MISSVFKRVAVLLALGAFATTASLPGQTTGVPGPAAVYSFLQKGKKVDYVLSANEVVDVDAQGKQTLVKLEGAGDARGVLARARKPSAGRKASYLVFYPLGLEGSARHRRILRDRMVVQLDADTDSAAVSGALGATDSHMFPSSPNRLVLYFHNAAETLSKIKEADEVAGVVSAEPLLARRLVKRFIPNDPLFAYTAGPYQWYLQNTGQGGALPGIDANVVDAWDTATGNGVTVAIVDDGVETEHPDLAGKVNLALSHNWNDGDPGDPNPTSAFDDHGTPVAGIVGATGDNLEGICGTAYGATLVGLRLIAGDVDDADEAAALSWNTDQIPIFNNSWGPPDDTTDLEAPGDLALAAIQDGALTGRGGLGTIYTWAGGNGGEDDDYSNYDGYANMPETIAVGAVADTGVKSTYSEAGSNLVVSAPSSGGNFDITTTNYQGELLDPNAIPPLYEFPAYTNDFGGTSAATPVVSGVVALMLEANPNLNWRDVQEILMASATQNDPSDGGWYDNAAGFHFNHKYGAGMVNATEAVNMAGGWASLPARTEQSILQIPIEEIPNGTGKSYIMQFDFSAMENLRVEHVEAVTTVIHEHSADLGIVLISPNGTQSVLAAPHENSTQQSISGWPFMTVRNWGEGSAGIWVLKIYDFNPDNSGVPNILNSVRLRLWGTVDPGAPVSQAPLLISDRVVAGIEGQDLEYLIETVGADTVTVGDLPPGLSYDAGSHTISGTPEEGGNFNTPITLTGSGGTADVIVSFIIQPIANALGAAVEQPDLRTFSSSSTPATGTWLFEFIVTNGDTESVGSPFAMGDNEWSEFGFREGTDGPGVVLYDWKVSSEAGFDRLFTAVGKGTPLQQWSTFIDGETVWRRVAVPLPEEGENPVAWRYMKDYIGTGGLDRGFVNNVVFMSTEDYANDLSAALNANFEVIQTGRTLWIPIDDTTVGGDARSLESSGIGNGQAVLLEATLQGPGELTFNWKISSEANDMLTLMVNGVPWETRAGDAGADWTPMTIDLPNGSNIVEWEFRKDISISTADDRAWLDEFNYLPVVGFEAWARVEGVASNVAGVAADPTADPDFDGYDNFMEYAWGSNPAVPDVSPRLPSLTTAPAAGGSTRIRLEYTTDSSRSDLIYTLEQSVDLDAWTPVPASPALVGSTGTLKTWRYEIQAPGDGPSKYFRVSVEQKP